jgi:5-methylcytosine-specific restriction endonuclease McrA
MRTCSHPQCPEENPQPLENFYASKTNADGLATRCKTCSKKAVADRAKKDPAKELQRHAIYREKNRVTLRVRNRDYRKTHKNSRKRPEKEIKKPDRTRINKIYIYLRDKGICQLCYKKVDPYDASFDHVIPRCEGGKDTLPNVVLTHLRCNLSKNKYRVTQQQRLLP